MSSAQALSALPLLWALLALLLWREQLRAPMLFLLVAVLTGFGAQAIASFLWLAWQAGHDQLLAVPPEEVSPHIAAVAAFKAIATIAIAAPIYRLLSKRL